MAWLFDIWKLMFWIPVVASAATGWFALESGILVRAMPLALWFLTSLPKVDGGPSSHAPTPSETHSANRVAHRLHA